MPVKLRIVVVPKRLKIPKINYDDLLSQIKEAVLPIAQHHWAATIDAFLYELYFAASWNAFLHHNFSGAMSAFYVSLYQRIYLESYWPRIDNLEQPHREEVDNILSTIKSTRTGVRGKELRFIHWWPKTFAPPIGLKKVRYGDAIDKLYAAGQSKLGNKLNFTQADFKKKGVFTFTPMMPEHILGMRGEAGSHFDKQFGQLDRPMEAARSYFRNRLPRQNIQNTINSVVNSRVKLFKQG